MNASIFSYDSLPVIHELPIQIDLSLVNIK
jgi:hypothetical protein